jgi:hypothetical protein
VLPGRRVSEWLHAPGGVSTYKEHIETMVEALPATGTFSAEEVEQRLLLPVLDAGRMFQQLNGKRFEDERFRFVRM